MMAQTTERAERLKRDCLSVDLPNFGDSVPLLLLPGTLCDARIFALYAEDFAGHPTVNIEISGAESTAELARRILADTPPRFALVGFSLGGIVALEIAAIAPDRVAGLALIATTSRADLASNATIRREAVADANRRGLAAHVADYIWPGSTAPANQNNETLKALAVEMAEAVGTAAYAEQAELAISRTDSRLRLPRLKVPTLILYGAADSVCPPARHTEMADAIPGAELAIIPDAGHFVLLEAPAAVSAHLKRWLQILSIDDTLTHRTARQTKDFQ